jgi:hypothetical protein
MTRIIIYVGLASFFIGCQTPCTHVMHNFQKLWVHIYIASLALSPLFKTALWGFRESQDQNIAIYPTTWESHLPKYLYYNAPAQYQQYYRDVTFFRNIYNVGLAFAILLVVFLVFNIVLRIISSSDSTFIKNLGNHTFVRHLKITFINRPVFYFNSIIFYQYFTVILACCFQFLDLKTRTNEKIFGSVNAAACLIAFILLTLYPIVLHIFLHQQRKISLDLLRTIMMNKHNKEFETYRNDILHLG